MHTTVFVCASAGAIRWKHACVCGNPWSRTTGGPLPPTRAKMRPACVSSQCEAESKDQCVDVAAGRADTPATEDRHGLDDRDHRNHGFWRLIDEIQEDGAF